ncbi:solute carrier family 46 member 3-like [Toxorhynchites rutilus septentrionalis]|uniref:solute carrier family 46 member 3-like n=1 Tax=Toxorhynchites rutilus septentrionalis TaxID=329112 RepID=UPI0024795478|nr:solute carrier family 46 member 3-like [Toxorhynchites rutilus septentrionalis]XP_055640596.1 solute carrier family 46 member 3-like [Toxorhynchites rutilus septentrionalis]XP_055640605.1 solute carrier family 46 member 3-like [Toxorhynchites rutilus septentrionalis]XP_055640614.1 solute carrier family 46 member 3-like [Toxorhynchites rutilus septentrionalis]XP_055640623.1 solute carrier family 46 member 3-like [Toxorhynchites rutilus septentrionalis]XP_055640629.1 solute carrier family 46 
MTNESGASLEKMKEQQQQQQKQSTMKSSSSLKEKLRYFKDNITVEPIVACYIMPSVLAGLATQNLNLEKACRVNLDYGETICDALTRRDTANYTHEEEMVQQIVARMAGWKTVLQSALPCLLILFWGSWSDRHGRRKPCILIPIIGEFTTAIGLILCTYFEWLPMEAAAVTEALFPALAGGWFTMFMGVFSYIADVTTTEERTLRIGIVNLCFSLGVPIGMAFSGILLKKIGFYGVFSISASLYLVAFFYGVFFLEEVDIVNEKERLKAQEKSVLADFFDKEHVVQTFRVAFKKGERQRRLRVIMLMIVVMVVIGPLHGEMSVIYLFTRYRFNWSEVEFSFFSTYGMLTGLIGTIFSVGVFSHMLHIDDALIGVMSCMSKILSSFVYAFAVTTWQLYLGPIVEMLNGTSFISMRSIASKLVASDELGKVNSLFGVAEALMPLVYAPMYTTVYASTINVLPGAFFLLGGGLTAPAVVIFLWMYRVHKREERILAEEEKQKDKFSQIADAPENGSAGASIMNGTIVTVDSVKMVEDDGGSVLTGRFGSMKRSSATRGSISAAAGRTNAGFVPDEGDTMMQETIEIMKTLPVLHVEHCKL